MVPLIIQLKCVSEGLHPETAIQMATLNTAECYGLKTKVPLLLDI